MIGSICLRQTWSVLLVTLSLSLMQLAPGNAAYFRDDFNGSVLNTSVWSLPTGAGSFFGRTQMRPPGQEPTVGSGVVRLQLDTYNSSARTPGDSFLGTEIVTNEVFPRGPGLTFEARSRLVAPVPNGLVASVFSYITNGIIRDEIDFELLSNDLNAGQQRVLTNVFDDSDFSEPGEKALATVAGLDLAEFNVYRVEWLPDRVRWLINGALVREEFDTVPNQNMNVRLNFWAPDMFFTEAYDGDLVPADTEGDNRTYYYEVDYVKVNSVPLPPALPLFLAAIASIGVLGWRMRKVEVNAT